MSTKARDALLDNVHSNVLAFPCCFQTGKARRCAQVLLNKSSGNAADYWAQTIQTIARRMTKSGFSSSAIEREIDAFAGVVQTEMERRYQRGERA